MPSTDLWGRKDRYFGCDLTVAYWNRRLAPLCRSTEHLMRNSKPNSEMPAMKEKAAKDKDKQARQKSIDKEKKGRAGGSGNRSKQLLDSDPETRHTITAKTAL
jgi:hypothetical protein